MTFFIDLLNIKLEAFKARKNWHPTISSHRQCQFLLLSPTKTTRIRTSLSAPSSLIYWPETFSILVIHWLTTHLYFSTQQRSIHSNKRKLTYLSSIGYLPMLMLYDAILEVLPYKLPISKLPPVLSSLLLCPLTHPLSKSYRLNYTLFQVIK